jgi:hypothetical protein
MGKLNQLKGVANNLTDSFSSVANKYFFEYLGTLPVSLRLIEINLLQATIEPKSLMSDTIRDIIVRYKEWFISQMKNFNINLDDIEKVIIRILYEKKKDRYDCYVVISAKGKEYVGEGVFYE